MEISEKKLQSHFDFGVFFYDLSSTIKLTTFLFYLRNFPALLQY